MSVESVLREMKAKADPIAVEGMARFGISSRNTLGLSIPTLRGIAKRLGMNHELALALWKSGIHEAKILAAMVDDPAKVTEKQMDKWVEEIDSWDVCDGCCGSLFDKTPFASDKATEWSERKGEVVNWAVRQIGKRNLRLNKEAQKLAVRISRLDSPSARWVASNALRELRSS